jgi:hypothetical protein
MSNSSAADSPAPTFSANSSEIIEAETFKYVRQHTKLMALSTGRWAILDAKFQLITIVNRPSDYQPLANLESVFASLPRALKLDMAELLKELDL